MTPHNQGHTLHVGGAPPTVVAAEEEEGEVRQGQEHACALQVWQLLQGCRWCMAHWKVLTMCLLWWCCVQAHLVRVQAVGQAEEVLTGQSVETEGHVVTGRHVGMEVAVGPVVPVQAVRMHTQGAMQQVHKAMRRAVRYSSSHMYSV
jgi:hypothetical protein